MVTPAEKAKLNLSKDNNEIFALTLLVDYVTRYKQKLKGNIAEMVLCALNPAIFRSCDASEGPVPTAPLENIIRDT